MVATPGRLADLLERKDCHLAASVRALVRLHPPHVLLHP